MTETNKNVTLTIKSKSSDAKKSVDDLKKSFKDLEGSTKELTKNSKIYDKAQKEADKTTKALSASTKLLIAGYAALFAKISKDGLNAFIQYEAQLRNVQSVTLDSEEQFKTMDKAIRQLTNNGLRSYAHETAAALYNVASAGIETSKQFDVLDKVLKTAAATLADKNDIAQIITGTMNAYGSEVVSATKISNLFVKTIQQGVTTGGELASSFGSVVKLGASAGVSIEDLTGSVALLTKNFIKTPDAITSIQGAIGAMIKPTEEAVQLAKNLGFELSAGALKSKGFVGMMQEMGKATGNDIELMGRLIPNVRALKGVLVLANNEGKDFADQADKMTDSTTSLTDSLEKQEQSVKANMGSMKQAFNLTLIEIGELIAKGFLPLIQNITKLLKYFNDMDDTSKKVVVGLGAITGAAATLTIGLAALDIAGISTTGVITKLTTSTKLSTTAFTAFGKGLGVLIGVGGFFYLYSEAVKNLTSDQSRLNSTIKTFLNESDLWTKVKNSLEADRNKADELKNWTRNLEDLNNARRDAGRLLAKERKDGKLNLEDTKSLVLANKIILQQSALTNKQKEIRNGYVKKYTKQLKELQAVEGIKGNPNEAKIKAIKDKLKATEEAQKKAKELQDKSEADAKSAASKAIADRQTLEDSYKSMKATSLDEIDKLTLSSFEYDKKQAKKTYDERIKIAKQLGKDTTAITKAYNLEIAKIEKTTQTEIQTKKGNALQLQGKREKAQAENTRNDLLEAGKKSQDDAKKLRDEIFNDEKTTYDAKVALIQQELEEIKIFNNTDSKEYKAKLQEFKDLEKERFDNTLINISKISREVINLGSKWQDSNNTTIKSIGEVVLELGVMGDKITSIATSASNGDILGVLSQGFQEFANSFQKSFENMDRFQERLKDGKQDANDFLATLADGLSIIPFFGDALSKIIMPVDLQKTWENLDKVITESLDKWDKDAQDKADQEKKNNEKEKDSIKELYNEELDLINDVFDKKAENHKKNLSNIEDEIKAETEKANALKNLETKRILDSKQTAGLNKAFLNEVDKFSASAGEGFFKQSSSKEVEDKFKSKELGIDTARLGGASTEDLQAMEKSLSVEKYAFYKRRLGEVDKNNIDEINNITAKMNSEAENFQKNSIDLEKDKAREVSNTATIALTTLAERKNAELTAISDEKTARLTAISSVNTAYLAGGAFYLNTMNARTNDWVSKLKGDVDGIASYINDKINNLNSKKEQIQKESSTGIGLSQGQKDITSALASNPNMSVTDIANMWKMEDAAKSKSSGNSVSSSNSSLSNLSGYAKYNATIPSSVMIPAKAAKATGVTGDARRYVGSYANSGIIPADGYARVHAGEIVASQSKIGELFNEMNKSRDFGKGGSGGNTFQINFSGAINANNPGEAKKLANDIYSILDKKLNRRIG